jgi:hypothetical protein
MERRASPGDGLTNANWYAAQTGSGFFDVSGPLGTPGSANVFDATPPVISSVTPTDGKLLPTGSGVTVSYAYTDETAMSANPTRTFKLEKNDGAGNYSDVTAASVASSGANAATATYTLTGVTSGAYRATFTVRDATGNQTQKISAFYVDAASLDVTPASLSMGPLSAGIPGQSGVMTVTLKTVGAPFAVTLGGSGGLSVGYDSIAAWNGSAGFGFGCSVSGSAGGSVCDGASTYAVTGGTLETQASNTPDPNGNLKTYTYSVRTKATTDSITSAGTYSGGLTIGIGLSY